MFYVNVGKAIWGVIQPILGPLLAYLKGRQEGRHAQERKARKNDDKLIEAARKDRETVRRDNVGTPGDELHDSYFRD